MESENGLAKWLALRRAGLGSTNFALLLKRFGTVEAAWDAGADAIGAAGIEPQFVRAFERARATFAADRELEAVAAAGATALTWLDEGYPPRLREIPQSPPVLFVRGSSGPEFERAVAVVGTRRVTPYGRQATEQFCEALALAGVAVISGLAIGVDTVAHRVALERGGDTVAVLAGGIDKIFPRENQGLADRILEHGALVSEYPPGIPARPDYFPRRNRIVSGLAQATLIIEAPQGSGALHTANWAFEQGRDVYAVPGSIYSRQSDGTNQLIRESTARLVATPEQLCQELNLLSAGAQMPFPTAKPVAPTAAVTERPSATTEEGQVLHWLKTEPRHIDEVARESGIAVARLSATLQVLELKGLVRQERPMVYVRA